MFIASIVLPIVFENLYLIGNSVFIAIIGYGYIHNRMMAYVEKNIYDWRYVSNRILSEELLLFDGSSFLIFLRTRLICRSKAPLFNSSVNTYCSNVGTVDE